MEQGKGVRLFWEHSGRSKSARGKLGNRTTARGKKKKSKNTFANSIGRQKEGPAKPTEPGGTPGKVVRDWRANGNYKKGGGTGSRGIVRTRGGKPVGRDRDSLTGEAVSCSVRYQRVVPRKVKGSGP